MASSTTSSLLITILSILIFALSSFKSSEAACAISVYWGRYRDEGSLREACALGNYKYVNIAWLTTFGEGRTPVLNLSRHCRPSTNECRRYSREIRYCQSRGIKVLLSLGGTQGNYSISSPEDATIVADYLWQNFLKENPEGPLGDAALDGVDFDIENPLSTLYWDNLARALSGFSTPERKIYLTAAPQCTYPDRNLDAAINTALFDYVWLKYYKNQSCDILLSWNQWSSSLPTGTELFIGLAASPKAGDRYIAPGVLNQILPAIKLSTNFGGIMVWNYNYDQSYSASISRSACACSCNCICPRAGRIEMVARNDDQ